ncbi:hypothetical protein M8R20_04925 [Pseudomonas sp. R2.Fl]|nr:hypothetical protein [Pseudomonas sp. R2.Fl]
MRVWSVFAIVWLCLLGSSASAQLTYKPLKIDGDLTVLVIEGTFDFTDDLQHFLLAVIQHDPQAVTFNSGGGNVVKALELGRVIRRLNMMTVQTREYECSSACAFAFLGGVHRFATPGSIGVHKASFEGTPSINVDDAVSSVQQMTAEVMSYIAEMGADPRLLELSLRYDKNDMRYLSISEMQQYKVTTDDGQTGPNVASLAPSSSGSSNGTEIEVTVPVETEPPPVRRVNLTIPVVKEATVRHPKGEAPVNLKPIPKALALARLKNGKKVQILDAQGSWFKVRTGMFTVGYMHETWLHPSAYETPLTEGRHIQIRSMDTYQEAEQFALQNGGASVYLASNGWFAVTLSSPLPLARANASLRRLKAEGLVPDDAFVTYGNTYVRKLCCD